MGEGHVRTLCGRRDAAVIPYGRLGIQEAEAGGQSLRVHQEQARDVPIVEETDVVVCGGGPAGVPAAIAADFFCKKYIFQLNGTSPSAPAPYFSNRQP